jgi:hypothetical protein
MPTAPGDVSYHKDIRPLIEARCVQCHTAGGAMDKIPLDSWTTLEPFKALVVNAVKSHRMPPWLADSTNCTKTRGDQRLTEAQLALFMAWEAKGFPAGVETEFKPLVEPPTTMVTTEPDILVKARTPFQLSAGIENYYCLATDASFAKDTWVYAMDLVPQNPQYVHHAIVNIGGTCDALGVLAQNIYSYRPGSRTLVFEKGDAMLFPAGSQVYIQFHYNTKYAERGAALSTDQSAFRLWTLPAGELPQRKVARLPNHDMLINIPVGAKNQREGESQSLSGFVGSEIIGISPHMHYLGQSFKELLHNGGQDTCLVDIPDWDQGWQLDYFFHPEDYIKVQSGASVAQTCIYNNGPEDQGVDPSTGKQFTPIYTTYGEDTRNEMCLGYIWFRTPMSGGIR